MLDVQNPEPPYFIQATAAPVLRGQQDNGQSFECENCAHLLIQNYVAEQYVQIGIKCFGCQHISYTPEIELGEVFTTRNLSLGETGDYRIEGPIDVPAGALITNDARLRTNMALTQPVDQYPPFPLSEAG